MKPNQWVAAGFLFASACATGDDWRDHDHPPMLGEAADCVYHDCLRENMAAAMAWEAIEEMCRQRAEAHDQAADRFN